ncbi:MAG: 4Fe-4S dicluster domain-containing protein [Rikenellaceae bacterium]
MNVLRVIRISLASLVLIAACLLFLDFTGSATPLLGWVAKLQLVPALLALHVGVVLLLLLLTLLFGRLYCSVLCPLGLVQDLIARLAKRINKKRKYSYQPPRSILRYSVLAIFALSMIFGVASIVVLLDPYSAFGRIVTNILSPLYRTANNSLALLAERVDSYAIYSTELILASGIGVTVALLTLALVGYMAWRWGRSYCNTICPVGTLLGAVSKFSLFKIVIDPERCNGCRKCVRECKSSCITPEDRKVDYSRCVSCFDCIDSCSQGAVGYVWRGSAKKELSTKVDSSRREMLSVSAALLTTTLLKAEEKMVDGGLAIIEDKQIPERATRIVPAGAQSLRNFARHCTGCQLCVSACPNHVLRASTDLKTFMQPEVSFERGYCRPECNRCSQVCPTGAIEPIDISEKSATQIGRAVVVEKNCVVLTDKVECGNCARHCPVGAITMVEAEDKKKYGRRKIPVVNVERCIGCGACENLCPARPFSAIYVEGHAVHKTV